MGVPSFSTWHGHVTELWGMIQRSAKCRFSHILQFKRVTIGGTRVKGTRSSCLIISKKSIPMQIFAYYIRRKIQFLCRFLHIMYVGIVQDTRISKKSGRLFFRRNNTLAGQRVIASYSRHNGSLHLQVHKLVYPLVRATDIQPGATFSIAGSYSFGSYAHFVLMVLLGNQCVPSARPTGNAHWNDNSEGFGALFNGRRGTITPINASSRG